MPFCSDCGTEYEEGRKQCPECGKTVIDNPEEEPPIQMIDYVPLRSLPSRLYAEMLQEALKREGIPSVIKSDDIAVTFGSYGTTSAVPVRIWVPKEDTKKSDEIAERLLNGI